MRSHVGTGTPINWTPEMDADLRRSHPTDELSTSIALRLGVSTDSVRKRQHVIGLGPRNHIKGVVSKMGNDILRAYRERQAANPGTASKPFNDDYITAHEQHLESVLRADKRGFPCAPRNPRGEWLYPLIGGRG